MLTPNAPQIKFSLIFVEHTHIHTLHRRRKHPHQDHHINVSVFFISSISLIFFIMRMQKKNAMNILFLFFFFLLKKPTNKKGKKYIPNNHQQISDDNSTFIFLPQISCHVFFPLSTSVCYFSFFYVFYFFDEYFM